MTLETSSQKALKQTVDSSVHKAAIVAGIGLLFMVATSPVAELYVFPKLIVAGNAEQSLQNITAHSSLFILGMFCYLITFIADIVVAWALYIFLKPANQHLSLLTALFRLVYAVITINALLNLVSIWKLSNSSTYAALYEKDELKKQVMICYYTFKNYWYFGLLFFSIHLLLLGYLAFISEYVPKIIALLLLICGAGYMATTLQPYLFSAYNIDFAKYTFYGELIFMLWLLIKGWRAEVKEYNKM